MLVESLAKINKEENVTDYHTVETLALEAIGQSWGMINYIYLLISILFSLIIQIVSIIMCLFFNIFFIYLYFYLYSGQFIPLFILEIRPYKEARLSTQRNPIQENRIEQNLRDVNSRSGGGELVLGMIQLSIYLSIYLTNCLFIYLNNCLFIYKSNSLCIYKQVKLLSMLPHIER
jgi:hypothetical protein